MSTARAAALAIVVSMSWTGAAPAQDAGRIVGVWRLVDNVNRDVATGAVDRPFGDRPTGTYVFSNGGQLVAVQFPAQPAAGAAPPAPPLAYSGSYKVEGNALVMTIAAASIAAWTGITRRLTVEAADQTHLRLTTEPFASTRTGKDVTATLTFERLE